MTQTDLKAFAVTFFTAVDAQEADGLRPFLTNDVRLQMANMEAVVGIENLITAFKATEERFSSIAHDIQAICIGESSDGAIVSVEAIAHYEIFDGRKVSLPVTSTLRLTKEGKIADYRIFMDPAPAFA